MSRIDLRTAKQEDIPALRELIQHSARLLRYDLYSPETIEAALRGPLGLDSQLVEDGTYFVAEIDGVLAGCGGWSQRRTLSGSDHAVNRDDALLDPQSEPAKIRAFFTHPDYARLGVATALLRASEQAARQAGFRRVELAATLPGEPFYARHGYKLVEPRTVDLPGGGFLKIRLMSKVL